MVPTERPLDAWAQPPGSVRRREFCAVGGALGPAACKPQGALAGQPSRSGFWSPDWAKPRMWACTCIARATHWSLLWYS